MCLTKKRHISLLYFLSFLIGLNSVLFCLFPKKKQASRGFFTSFHVLILIPCPLLFWGTYVNAINFSWVMFVWADDSNYSQLWRHWRVNGVGDNWQAISGGTTHATDDFLGGQDWFQIEVVECSRTFCYRNPFFSPLTFKSLKDQKPLTNPQDIFGNLLVSEWGQSWTVSSNNDLFIFFIIRILNFCYLPSSANLRCNPPSDVNMPQILFRNQVKVIRDVKVCKTPTLSDKLA